MISKIIEIIKNETWVEVDSAQVYGIEEAAKKILEYIEKNRSCECGSLYGIHENFCPKYDKRMGE